MIVLTMAREMLSEQDHWNRTLTKVIPLSMSTSNNKKDTRMCHEGIGFPTK
jgi:hypothetical protein